MAINKKLISFATQAQFDLKLNAGDIDNRSIVFIEDKKRIWTHGVYFDTSWNYITGTPDTLAGYNITDAASKINSLYYVIGNTSGTAGAWTGTVSEVTSLYEGLTIAYKIGVAGASTTNLNLNGLGNKLVRRNTGNMTTHLPVGTIVLLTYNGTNWVWADYDSNTTYAAMSVAEGVAGTAVTLRTMRADYLKQIIEHHIANTVPSAHTLGSHSDVTITSNSNGEILRWNGTNWINNTLAEAGIASTGQLNNYLPLAGGTMSGSINYTNTSGTNPMLVMNRASGGGAALARLNITGYDKGLGLSNNGDLIFGDWSGVSTLSTSWNKVWHSGNITPVPTARTITAGNGLTGGGDLSANRTLTLGTPSSITSISTNSVTSTSHTHALTMGSGSGLDADLLDGKHASDFEFYKKLELYNVNTGFLKIKFDWGSTSHDMFSITIRLYQGYQHTDIKISAYNYATSYWHAPKAEILSSSLYSSLDISFGYDELNQLFIVVPKSSYTQVAISDYVGRYGTAFFSNIAMEYYATLAEIPGTIQSTVSAYGNLKNNQNAVSATKLQTAQTLTIGNTGKTFDGTANVTWSLSEIGALPLTGGTMSNTNLVTNLNANLLDGLEKGKIVYGSNNLTAVTSQSDITTAYRAGFYASNGTTTGYPAQGDSCVAILPYVGATPSYRFGVRIGGWADIYHQLANGAGVGTWYKIWSEKNFKPADYSLKTHNHTLKLIAGTSTATVDSTVDVANPYIRLFSDNVHQGNIQIVGGANVGVVSKNGIITLSSSYTNTTYTTGTLAQLNAGADTTGRLQTAKLLNDWLNPKLNGKLNLTGGVIEGSLDIKQSTSAIPALGARNSSLYVTANGLYGMQFGIIGSGVGFIQQGRTDGTATSYNLSLQPSGGNVLINNQVAYHAGNIPTWNQSTTGNAATASAVLTSAENSSTASRYILFADNASGNQALKTDTGLKYVPSTNTISANISGNLSGGTVNGTALGVTNVSASTGLGLSLYGGPTTGIPQYGMTFAGTPTFGTHGAVTGDWATYFTMTGATSRGWIFKLGTTNVASISAAGVITAPTFIGALSGKATSAGTADTADNATKWASQGYSATQLTTTPTYLMGYDGSNWRPLSNDIYEPTVSSYSFTKSLQLSTTWQDTGIAYNNIPTGTYAFSVYANNSSVGGGNYTSTFSGVINWYSGGTNSTTSTKSEEILMHGSGHHVPNHIYIRTSHSASSSGTHLRLQIATDVNTSAVSSYIFKFKQII